MRGSRDDGVERLVAEHGEAVYLFFRRRTADHASADDLTADTFAIAWRRIADVPDEPELARRWLYKAARNQLLNWRRGRRRADALQVRIARQPGAGVPAVEDVLAEQQAGESLRRALDRLGEADREVVQLAAWEGLTGEALAEVLGCSTSAAWSRLHRARQRLWDAWRAETDDEGTTAGGGDRG